jgi:mannose-6-phosphate isomerase-like protein (cupin superfamily)
VKARRVVTGHDASGRAIVLSDEELQSPPAMAAGIEGMPLWTTQGFPPSNDGDRDTKGDVSGITMPDGTAFALVRLEPGCAPFPHRTSSLDYGVIVSGEIDMEMDDGVTVHFKAGDVYVQRGTMHTWINRGSEACVLAAIVIDAKPVQAGGRLLEATAT